MNITKRGYTTVVAFILVLFVSLLAYSLFNNNNPSNNLSAISGSGSGLVAHYEFEGNTNDSSGSGNNGTPSGGPTYISGKIGQAMSFDGINDRVDLASTITAGSDATYSFWVKPTGTTYRTVFGANVNDEGAQITPEGSIGIGNGTNVLSSSNGAVPNNAWTHVVFTWDGTNTKVYINSSLDNQTNANAMSDVALIGIDYTGAGDEFMHGSLDDVRIYNRALSSSEIQELYTYNDNTQVNGQCGSSNGGTFSQTPTSNLCSQGSSSSVSLSGSTYSWTCSGSNGGTTASCSANYTSTPTQYTLSVSKSGTGSGTVTSSPSGISCGSDCTETVNQGTSITLTASPSSGSTFQGWSGGGCSGTGSCTVTLSSNTTVGATFNVQETSGNISCDQTTLQNTINSATNGATITCNKGNWTWSNSVSIPSTKGITINGNNSTINGKLYISQNSSASTRITGFNFSGGSQSGYTGQYIYVGGSKDSAPFRLDNNTFTTTDSGSTLLDTEGNAPGLIDHNSFNCPDNCEIIHNLGMGTSNSSGWLDDIIPGSWNAVYLEDNIFTNTNNSQYFYGNSAIQSYYGSRTVLRHNTFNFSQIDQHGTAGQIGARWWEIYDNIFNVPSRGSAPVGQCCFVMLRAGSGVVFNNHHTGVGSSGSINLYEEDTGYPALYQIGRGKNQVLDPAYVWNNDSFFNIESATPDMVQANRDYYLSAKPGYTPFTYPYPLTANGLPNPAGGGTTPPPSKPADFNNDGVVNSIDYAILLQYWNTSSATHDLNNDGIVNSIDYVILVQNWG